jgi:hypothetical protein
MGFVPHLLDCEFWSCHFLPQLLNNISKIGSVIFSHTESWTYGQSMYFCESLRFAQRINANHV